MRRGLPSLGTVWLHPKMGGSTLFQEDGARTLDKGGRGVVHFLESDGAEFGPIWLEEATIFGPTLTKVVLLTHGRSSVRLEFSDGPQRVRSPFGPVLA